MSERGLMASGGVWRRRCGTWVALSLVLHGMGVAAILWLTPDGIRARQAGAWPRPLSGVRIEQLAAALRTRAVAQIRADIVELEQIQAELEALGHQVAVRRPVCPESDCALPSAAGVRTYRRFEQFRLELATLVAQAAEMVSAARRGLEAAFLIEARAMVGVDAPYPVTEEDLPHFVADMVSDYHGGRVVDLTEWMRAATNRDGDGEGRVSRDAYPYDIMGPARFERQPPARLTLATPMTGARRIDARGWSSDWVYVDSWYTLGPFPNPGRENVQREFPPDRTIDLNADYAGKDGRRIRWQFVQSQGPKIHPADPDEYGVWYAYTELYLDRARDLWVALGSDDYGRLQVNGITVWESSLGLKGWRIDEAWRRVSFRSGINQLLFRLENGWRDLGFSVTLWFGDEA